MRFESRNKFQKKAIRSVANWNNGDISYSFCTE